jgi:hypothetical protein
MQHKYQLQSKDEESWDQLLGARSRTQHPSKNRSQRFRSTDFSKDVFRSTESQTLNLIQSTTVPEKEKEKASVFDSTNQSRKMQKKSRPFQSWSSVKNATAKECKEIKNCSKTYANLAVSGPGFFMPMPKGRLQTMIEDLKNNVKPDFTKMKSPSESIRNSRQTIRKSADPK